MTTALRIFTKDEMIYLILWMTGYGGTFFFFFKVGPVLFFHCAYVSKGLVYKYNVITSWYTHKIGDFCISFVWFSMGKRKECHDS